MNLAKLTESGEIVSIYTVTEDDTPAYGDLVEVPNWPGWASRPTTNHRPYLVAGDVYWIDSRPLDYLKTLKNSEINAARLAANKSFFTFMGKQIACDELSRSDIDGVNGIVSLTGSLPTNFPGAWKAIDNSYVLIPDVTTWTSMYSAMVAQGITNFSYAQELKGLVAAASTAEEVAAIYWGMT